LAFFLALVVLIPGIGHVVNGSRRWLRLGPFTLQASEAIKLCTILYMSSYFMRHKETLSTGLLQVIKPLAILAMIGLLLLMEPDFGATVVLFVSVLGMMFMAGVRIRWFVILLLLGAFLVTMLVIFSPYRLARFTGFLDPWQHQYGSGYQLTQALIAFGRGGFFGLGLGQSIQKMFFLPEAHTDFIFAIIGEELGLVGVLVVLGLYSTFVYLAMNIASRAQKAQFYYGAWCAYGMTFWLSFQVIVNIGVNLGLLPTKGLTLPFMSYGGSSLLLNCLVVGILMRIDYQTKIGDFDG